jgi:hypothetical protein
VCDHNRQLEKEENGALFQIGAECHQHLLRTMQSMSMMQPSQIGLLLAMNALQKGAFYIVMKIAGYH